jgi:hypothetical protein
MTLENLQRTARGPTSSLVAATALRFGLFVFPPLQRREDAMTKHTYDKEITALLVIDPYNDFISEGGKIWDRIRAVAEANDCVLSLSTLLGRVSPISRPQT